MLPRFTTPTGGGITLRPLAEVPATRYVVGVLRPDRAERLVVATVLRGLQKTGKGTR